MRLLAEKQEADQEVALVTVISSDCCSNGLMMAVDREGTVLGGSFGNDLLDQKAAREAKTCLNRGLSRKAYITLENSSTEIFTTALGQHDRLLIAGAGSVAHYVYQIARLLGYKVTIFDNRAEMLTRERFPEAHELILGDIVKNIASYYITEDVSIVIATHHHEFDEAILQKVIASPAGYIGMLSNSRKITVVFDNLRALGIADELIAKVHSPIGLNLGGKKTAEIALAIMAEIQAVKYGRTFNVSIGKSKSD
jgi:xanthine dehydrogenase accessory factor